MPSADPVRDLAQRLAPIVRRIAETPGLAGTSTVTGGTKWSCRNYRGPVVEATPFNPRRPPSGWQALDPYKVKLQIPSHDSGIVIERLLEDALATPYGTDRVRQVLQEPESVIAAFTAPDPASVAEPADLVRDRSQIPARAAALLDL